MIFRLLRASAFAAILPPLQVSALAQTQASFSVAEVVDRARTAPAAPLPWPGFDIRKEILIVTSLPDGPTAIVGDGAPPREYQPVAVHQGVFLRPGAPPDSLSGLQLARDWNGRQGAATVVSVASADLHTIETVIHEAFHSFQTRTGGRGAAMVPMPFGDTLLALAVLDGRALLDAARAPDSELRDRLVRALHVRAARCRALGAACAQLRDLEAYEGPARYIASLSLHGRNAMVERASLDTSSVYTLTHPAPASITRFHAYATGELWLSLLDRLEVADWPTSVARSWTDAAAPAPDEILATSIGFKPDDALTPATLLATADGMSALTHARVQQAEAARRRSARAPTPPSTHRLVTIDLPDDLQIGMSMVPVRGGGRETRIRFGDNTLVVQQRYRERGHSAWVDIAGKTATVDGQPFPLDKPGKVTGRVVLDLPEIRATLSRATVESDGTKVVITYLP